MSKATRKALTPEEKERYNLYIGKKTIHYKAKGDVVRDFNATDAAKVFGVHLKEVLNFHQAIVTLYGALIGEGPNTQIAFPVKDGNFAVLTRSDIRDAERLFKEEIKELKQYFLYSRKGRKESLPDSFKGSYSPVFLGDALIAFFTDQPDRFGLVDPSNKNSGMLMDQLRALQDGYAMKMIVTRLFYTYLNNNDLQNPENRSRWRADDYIRRAFDGTIPASFTDSESKTLMSKSGGKMNTFDALVDRGKSFDKDDLWGYNISSICSINSFTRKTLKQYANETFDIEENGKPAKRRYGTALEGFDDPKIQKDMLADHEVVVRNRDAWKLMNKK